MHLHVAGMLSKQPTNKQTYCWTSFPHSSGWDWGTFCRHLCTPWQWTSKILMCMSFVGECQLQKHNAPSLKMECEYWWKWLSGRKHKKLTDMVIPRIRAGEQRITNSDFTNILTIATCRIPVAIIGKPWALVNMVYLINDGVRWVSLLFAKCLIIQRSGSMRWNVF